MVWVTAGTVGPIALLVGLIGGSAASLWVGIALCGVWASSLVVDWLLVQRLEQHVDGWTPWRPPTWRWLKS